MWWVLLYFSLTRSSDRGKQAPDPLLIVQIAKGMLGEVREPRFICLTLGPTQLPIQKSWKCWFSSKISEKQLEHSLIPRVRNQGTIIIRTPCPMSGTHSCSSGTQGAWTASFSGLCPPQQTHSSFHRLRLDPLCSCCCPWWLFHSPGISCSFLCNANQPHVRDSHALPSSAANMRCNFLPSLDYSFCGLILRKYNQKIHLNDIGHFLITAYHSALESQSFNCCDKKTPQP